MYGTIFNIKVKEGHEQLLLDLFKQSERVPKGMVAWFLMDPDEDKDWIGVAIFESKEAHLSNANDPEQGAQFTQLMEHIKEEPTWTDGTFVISEIMQTG